MGIKKISVDAELTKNFTIESQIRDFKMYIDQPDAGNKGPTPVELLLFAYAGCIGTVARIAARQKRIRIKSMKINVEGEFNNDELMGRECDDRGGFKEFHLNVDLDADMTKEEKIEFLKEVDERCPLSDTFRNGAETIINIVD